MKKESNMGLLFLMAVGIAGLGLYYGATDNYGSGEIQLYHFICWVVLIIALLRALELVSKLRGSFERSRERNRGYAAEFADIPLTGRAIIEQQGRLYGALLDWLDEFERELRQ